MVNIYTSELYIDPTLSQMIASIKDGISILTAQTDTEVSQVITDTTTEYEVLLSAGNGVYFDVHIASGYLSVSYGAISEGAYVAWETSEDTSLGHQASMPFYCKLGVINGSDLWDFMIVFAHSGVNKSYQTGIRSTTLESSLPEIDTLRCARTYWYGGSTSFNSFPHLDKAYLDNAYVTVRASGVSATEGANNVPDGKLMLFPALLSLAVACPLGVPTIGSKIAYSMIGGRLTIPAFTEFVVGGSRFVSLGSVAIRSS